MSLVEAVDAEVARGFQTVRGSALVAVCGSFEHLIKARFVAFAASNPLRAADLLAEARPSLKVDASDVLGTPALELWFLIADALFRRAGEGGRPMSERVKVLLLKYAFMPGAEGDIRRHALETAFANTSTTRTFNRAFLYRNCLVHNGARVDRKLSAAIGTKLGEEIELDNAKLREMMSAIRSVAEELSPYWVLSLD